MAVGAGTSETARLADIGARWLTGKPLSALTAGIPPAAAADLTEALALAGRVIERESARSSANAAS